MRRLCWILKLEIRDMARLLWLKIPESRRGGRAKLISRACRGQRGLRLANLFVILEITADMYLLQDNMATTAVHAPYHVTRLHDSAKAKPHHNTHMSTIS